jgi:hypothetical protein
MSASSQTAAPSADNLTTIFKAATDKYQKLTGIRLDTHPFTAQLDACQNPEAISNFLRTEAQAFSKFRKGDERLMVWLDPTIHILFSFSATLGEEIGLVGNLAHLHMTVIGHLVLRLSRRQERSLRGLVFFSVFVFPPVPHYFA